MPDHIRYAWSMSSLGDVLVAVSDRGLVAFEFSDQRPATLDVLRSRFPEAAIVEDDAGLAVTVAKLMTAVDHPDRAVDLELDIRGSDEEKRIWNTLREIPAGETATYGEIAARLGSPRLAYVVAEACAANTIAILIPCHRVVKKDGSISGYRWGFRRKRELLSRERKVRRV
jgi:AraC family transcriptional regulator of adaptative response/methylated-DNA-[protein]-cysteine methyltransferase